MRVGVLAGLLTFVAGEWRCACAQWHSMPRDPLSPWLHRCSAVGGRRGRRLGARALWAWRTSGWPQLGRHAAIHAQVREVGTGTGTVGCVGRTLSVLAGVGRSEKKAKRKSGWLVRSAPRSAIFVGASARFVVGRGDRLVGDSIRAPHWRSCIPGGRRIAPISVRCWPCTQVPLPTGRGGP